MPQFPEDLDEDFDDRPLEGKKILLAEDEERLRIIVAMMIEELGAEVITVADGKSALDEYSRSAGSIDLVILDMRMKGLSGGTTFKLLLDFDPDVKVVFSSGIRPDDDLLDLLIKHRAGFIEKPFNLTRLGEVLSKVLAGEAVV